MMYIVLSPLYIHLYMKRAYTIYSKWRTLVNNEGHRLHVLVRTNTWW